MDRREFLKLVAAYAAGAAVLGSAGCSHRLVPSDNLVVQDGFDHPYTFMTEQEGERRLAELACSYDTEAEESWLVFKVGKKGKNPWIDIGYKQEEGHVDMCAEFVDEITDDLRRTVGPEKRVGCLSYHPHIIRAVIRKLKEMPAAMKKTAGLDGAVQMHHAEIISCPTGGDLAMHIDLKQYLQKKDLVLEQSRIVSPTGIFSYDSTPGLERLYRNSGIEAMEFIRDGAAFRGFNRKDVEGSLELFREQGVNIDYRRSEKQRVKFPIRI